MKRLLQIMTLLSVAPLASTAMAQSVTFDKVSVFPQNINGDSPFLIALEAFYPETCGAQIRTNVTESFIDIELDVSGLEPLADSPCANAEEPALNLFNPRSGMDEHITSTWIYRITANKCLDRLRKKTPDQLPEDYDAATDAEQDKTLYDKQLASLMEKSLKTLPERQYLALTLFHYQGLKMQEVAEIMDCSSEAVESLLARARRSLKQKLKPTWQEYREGESPKNQKQKEGELL